MSRQNLRARRAESRPDLMYWHPEKKGDEAYGELVSTLTRGTKYGEHLVYVLRDEDGHELGVAAYHAVLRNKLEELSPGAGDELLITYLGELPRKTGGGSFHAYDVLLERNQKELDLGPADPKADAEWDADGPTGEDERPAAGIFD